MTMFSRLRRLSLIPAVALILIAAAPVAPVSAPPLTAPDAAAIVAAWHAAPEFVMPPGLPAQAGLLASPDPVSRAAADLALSNAAIRLADLENGQIRDPKSINPDWAMRAPFDAQKAFAAARASGSVATWAASLPRANPAYLGLLTERRRYEAIRAKGGWPTIPPGPDLKPGDGGQRVAAVRARLVAEGFLAADSLATGPYDAALSAAVAAFQSHHRTKPDGIVNARTLKALNKPVADRLAAIDASMERERWLPDRLPPERIEVDVAGAHATLFQADRAVLTMRVIVGGVTHKTPVFAAKMTGIVLNPPWNVPDSIAKAELYPKERRSPGYFARNGIVATAGRLIQRPGPKASLGLLKFDLDDPYAIYLHDTPARGLFAQHHRALSHGCMRLEAPRPLAVAILAAQGWTAPSLDAAIATGTTRTVALKTPLPVFVVYRTAQTAPDGRVQFRHDVYGWDAKLGTAMGAR